MGTCHKGLLGNLGAKDGAFGKYLVKRRAVHGCTKQEGLETDSGFGFIELKNQNLEIYPL